MAFNIPMSSPSLMPGPHQFQDIRISKVVPKTIPFNKRELFEEVSLSKLDLAANKINFSTPLLRSYSKVYESLGGRLTHDSQGMKIYGDELLEAFKQVREQVHEGHLIQDAMKAAFEVDKSKTKVRTKQTQPVDKKKLSQLLQSNAVLSEEIEDLRRELKYLKKDKTNWLSKLARAVY